MEISELSKQFLYARSMGWMSHFEEAAEQYNLDIALIMAIASRETNMRNILGDYKHGHGVMQVDDRSFAAWCATDAWRDPRMAIIKGSAILAQKIKSIRAFQGRVVLNSKKQKCLTPRGLSPAQIERLGVAAYNCGEGNAIYGLVEEGSPDYFTAHGDYSKDVLERRAAFRELLDAEKH